MWKNRTQEQWTLLDLLAIAVIVVGVSWGVLTLAEALAAKVPEVSRVDVQGLWNECNRRAQREVSSGGYR